MNSTENEVKKSLSRVLDLTEEITTVILRGEELESSKIEAIKEDCKLIAEAGLYPFDINLPIPELVEQIKDFGGKING